MSKGRTKIFTDERAQKICAAIRAGATMEIAARCGGISKATLYRWLVYGEKNRKPQYVGFAKDFREAEGLGALDALTTIQTSIKQGDVKSAIWLLSRRHGYKPDAAHEIPEVREETAPVSESIDYRTVLLTQIAELRESMTKAKESGSWQAYAALQRQMVSLLSEVRALDAEDGALDQYDNMSDEQVLSEIVNTIIALPPVLRQRVESDLRSLVSSNVIAMKKGS